jgi:hypothetical protein
MSDPKQLEMDFGGGAAATPKPPIIGYRALSDTETKLINEIKAIGNEVGRLVEGMGMNGHVDQRWVAIARTDLQKGFMALVRAVAQPNGF